MSGGRALAEMLRLADVGPMFGMGGFQLLPFYDALSQLGMRHAEAVVASTVNAAAAVGLAGDRGQIAPGFAADLVACDLWDWREVAYWAGANLVTAVWTAGSACPLSPPPVSLGIHVEA